MSKGYPGSAGDTEKVPRHGDYEGDYLREKDVNRENSEDLEFLMSRWSTKMQTFVTAWGEFALTLEDVVALTSLPVFGDTQIAHFKLSDKDSKARYDALMQFL